MKSILKKILVSILGSQVRRLRSRKNFKIIGVVGSTGKTSTKLAIAKMLETEKRVRYQEGNYNDLVSVPLVIFGHAMPQLWNIWSWIIILIKNEWQVLAKFPFDIVVLELGTDAPGQISQFRKYLNLDIAILTAITPEHMEFFETIEKVAEEEWSVSFFSDHVFANKDLCRALPKNLDHKKVTFYGKGLGSFYKIENVIRSEGGFNFDISKEGKKIVSAFYPAVSAVQLYSVCAAVMVANTFKIPSEKIRDGIDKIRSFSGRMQKLKGIKNSTIVDDTYNSSPEAAKMALESIYAIPAPQRIAILGMMNELGETSEAEHRKIGKLCNPKFLDLVVTIGKDANRFLAPEASKKGCDVLQAKDAVDAGFLVRNRVKNGSLILAKGSQNGVFAEEALKPILADPNDFSRLVRQNKEWMRKKKYLSHQKFDI